MILLLVLIAIDALVLIGLLKLINDDEVDFGPAFGFAFAVAVVSTLLEVGFSLLLGPLAGTILGAIVAAIILGIAVSAFFGVEIKRSFLIAVSYMVVTVCINIGFSLLLS